MTAARGRVARRRVDGVLLLDKPVGLTSNAALQSAKRLFAAEKAGHTGTLDPLASGLLPICFGEATKFAQTLLTAGKAYVTDVRFGIATATGDAEGEVLRECPVAFERADLERVLPRFTGAVTQVPPRHAALKFEGRPYYDYARAGVDIPRPPRTVIIDAIELVAWESPVATLRVRCGKGTYIRVLGEDLGEALGCCAHLAALRRTATGPYDIADAVTLDALADMDCAGRDGLLRAVDTPLVEMPRLDLDAESVRALREGRIAATPARAPGTYRGYGGDGTFVGVVAVSTDGMTSVRLMRTPEGVCA